MTAPKGTQQQQVERLRLKAIENLSECFDKGGTGSEAIAAFGALCRDAETHHDELALLAARVGALEAQFGQMSGKAMRASDGTLQMGDGR